MKSVFRILFILTGLSSSAQNYENNWTGYFSYTGITKVVEGDDKLIAASENAVFTYDFTRKDIETISTVNGLSGELISALYYSDKYNLIVIGYQNGLIEVVRDNGNVLKVVDILNKPTIPPNIKHINHFNEYEENLYIATGYGISVFNMALLEFGDTYYIGNLGQQVNVNATAVHEGFIYASMNNQMKRALVSSTSLIDYNQWHVNYNFGTIGLQVFRGNLYALNNANSLLVLNGAIFNQIALFPQNNRSIYANDDYMTVTTATQSRVFDRNMVQTSVTSVLDYPDYSLSSSLAFNNMVYLGTREYGVLEVSLGSTQAIQILPDGPLMNSPFAIDAAPGQLWIVFGEHTVSFNPWPYHERGISHFENNTWTNIPYEDVHGARSISYIKINPLEPTEAYASSFVDGLLRIQNTTPSILFNQTNSGLDLDPNGQLRILGSTYDRQGNFWFLQSKTDTGLKKLTTSGQLQNFDITSVINNPVGELALTRIAVGRQGNVFFGTASNGLIGFNPDLNMFKRINTGLGNGNLPSPDIRALAFDSRNQLWIGTYRGLRVLNNTAGFFQEGANIDAQQIIILEDGVPQELLYEQSITDIEVDGSNNKWVATATSGVFYFSPNGQETLLRFHKDNSPLPSNNVRDIAIDPVSGVVYFATVNGLVAYNGSATAPNDNLKALRAYPNPVRPGFNGNVTIDGLTARANVKITDVNGSLVFEQTSEGGSILWDTTAFGKYKVASGVYFIMATTDDAQETKIAKIMIIR